MEAVSADTSHVFGRHTHDRFGIGVILRGAQRSMSGRGVIEAMAGDVITVNPGEVHDGAPLDDNGRSWSMLYFDPSALAEPILALTDNAANHAEFTHPAMRDATTAHNFLSLFQAMTDPNGGHSEIGPQENLLFILAHLIDLRPCGKVPASTAIERACARIDDDPAAPLSLGELATISDLSQFQLIRGFSKMTGLTPHAYLVQRRLQRARRMISDGTPLAEAAHASGFADQSHMTRLFIRTYGMSPGIYAAAMKGSAISFKI